MWRAAKAQSPDLVVAVVESWGWIHLLVEAEVVQYEYDGFENDSACAAAISTPHYTHDICIIEAQLTFGACSVSNVTAPSSQPSLKL